MAAFQATLLAIRAVRNQIDLGARESQVNAMIKEAIQSTGLETDGGLVLFGPDAALPHGTGTDRVLTAHDFVLVDAGGTLHGYWSDVTRTFAVQGSRIYTKDLDVWYIVQAAQRAAHQSARRGTRASQVDHAARIVIEQARYGPAFTHRLGHGKDLLESTFY